MVTTTNHCRSNPLELVVTSEAKLFNYDNADSTQRAEQGLTVLVLLDGG